MCVRVCVVCAYLCVCASVVCVIVKCKNAGVDSDCVVSG